MALTFTGDPNSHDISKYDKGMSSTCLCGAIKVTITDTEPFTKVQILAILLHARQSLILQPGGHLCHCANCRKVAGSYVSSNLAIEKGKVDVQDERGVMKKYRDYATASGKCVERCFCGECGKYASPGLLPLSTFFLL